MPDAPHQYGRSRGRRLATVRDRSPRTAITRRYWEALSAPVPLDPPTVMEILRVLRLLTDDRAAHRVNRVRLWWLRLLLRAWRWQAGQDRSLILSRRYLRRLFEVVERCRPSRAEDDRHRGSLLTLLNLMLLDTMPTGTRVAPGG
jgi:hypothetical protein